jgi:hypothetical protein
MNEKEVLLSTKVAQILDKSFVEVAHNMSLMKIIEELVGVIESERHFTGEKQISSVIS